VWREARIQPEREFRASQFKSTKARESKMAFHRLSFIFPNLDFSMGYERKTEKLFLLSPLASEVARKASSCRLSIDGLRAAPARYRD
jgi:hypothetical protein